MRERAGVLPFTDAFTNAITAPKLRGLGNLGIYGQKFNELNLHIFWANKKILISPTVLALFYATWCHYLLENNCYARIPDLYFLWLQASQLIAMEELLLFVVQAFSSIV